jgi:hypothetical protein
MTNNSYVDYVVEKGFTAAEARQTARRMARTFPCTIGARTFETEEQYQDALADFLNGN